MSDLTPNPKPQLQKTLDSLVVVLKNPELRQHLILLPDNDETLTKLAALDKIATNFTTPTKYKIGKILTKRRKEIKADDGDYEEFYKSHGLAERTDRKYRALAKKIDKLLEFRGEDPDYQKWLLDLNITEIDTEFLKVFPKKDKEPSTKPGLKSQVKALEKEVTSLKELLAAKDAEIAKLKSPESKDDVFDFLDDIT